MNPFQSLRSYEDFIYKLKELYPIVQHSTLVIVPSGNLTAVLRGELTFPHGYRVSIRERLSLDGGTLVIEFYGYEFWHNTEKIAWYDAQPHPNEPSLQSTHPHHKHVPPNIKRNRIPAPNMSFTRPNIPALVADVEALLEKAEMSKESDK